MEPENTPPAPTSIILIAVFWIFLGTFIITITSRYLSAPNEPYLLPFGFIPFMFGIVFIMIGWGLLTERKWAYSLAVIFSLIGTVISLFFNTLFLASRFFSIWSYYSFELIIESLIPVSILLAFIVMTGYLIKNKKYFEKRQ